ncbi:barstar family protein [Planobispora rosea]|uniref:barstar family protein n=1 Tax=Planobispora rosea TaxID=35762 RepID=UPI00083B1F36|nr:barstar family protein [Planobispora rosea]
MDQVWTWDQHVPPRWLLIDEGSSGVDGSDVPLAMCADIDGLFVEPAPLPAAEQFTLIGCEPAGLLREALAQVGTDRAWLGDIVLDPVHGSRRPEGCQPYSPGCSCMEELLDVTVLRWRRSAAGAGLIDVDLRGHLRILPEYGWPPAQPPAAHAFTLTGSHGGPALGTCRQIAGVFRERPRPPVQPITLLGCRPEPPLQALMEQQSARRRQLKAEIYAIDRSGHAVTTTQRVSATVTGSRPSRLGAGLIDIVLDDGLEEPLPPGAREIWKLWHTGRPARPNLWAGYDRALRHEWSGAALFHRGSGRPDRPAGHTFCLDGRFVTDIEGFYCALGEAINGPGGYFGWNLSALDDCLRGGWGAMPPFRLIWHHAEVARRHLVPGYDRPAYTQRTWGPATTLQDLLDILTEGWVNVDLR